MVNLILKKSVRISSAIILSAILLAGCSSFGKKKDTNEFAGWSVDRIYNQARDELNNKDYKRSSELLEAAIAQYPFSAEAVQAQLELPYVYWKDDERSRALAATDRFIATNPSHPKIDYIYYIKGIIHYNQNVGFLPAITVSSKLNDRDPQSAKKSFAAFKTLVEKFPNSRYVKDSRERMILLTENLAKQEISIANYYLERGAYIAAVNRSQEILRNFDGTPATESALIIMIKAYEGLKIDTLRDDTRLVLLKNYPNSTGEFKQEKTWSPLFVSRKDRKLAHSQLPSPE